MADVKITDLVELTDPEDDDVILIDEDSTGDSKYIKHSNLRKGSGLVNLLGNSGFGVWSNSDANKGLGTIVYDNLAGGTFSAGDPITQVAPAGPACKVISDNGTTTMVMGAATGTFQDNAQITNGAGVTADVNGDTGIGIKNDPMNNDSTADWTDDGANIALAFAAAEYTVTTNAATQRAWIAAVSLTAGKLFKIELDIKDGTAAGQDIEGYFNDGAAQYGAIETTAAGWASVSWTFECVTTTAAGLVGFRIPTSLAGNNIEVRRFSCYEITPCCTAADNLAMDDWYKDTTLDIYREHSGANVQDGSFYGCLSVPTAQNDYCYTPGARYDNEEWYMRFQGRDVTIGAWVLSSTANDIVLEIEDSAGSTTSTAHTGGGAFEWLEVTHTVNAAATSFRWGWKHENASPGNAYICQAQGVFGSSIGEGNYVQMPGEWVNIDPSQRIRIISNGSPLATDDKVLNIEVLSEGKIPKGCRALNIRAVVSDSAIAAYAGIEFGATLAELALYPQVNNVPISGSGFVNCDSNGDIYQTISAAGNTLSGLYADIFSVQVS